MKTLVLLRHADVDEPPDPVPEDWSPDLNDAGRERAKALVHVLANASVASVFVSPAERTRQTAAPLVANLSLSFQIVSTWSQTVERALSAQAGEVVVIIGHSNTVPKMINALVGASFSDAAILQGHEDLFIVTVVVPNNAGVLHLKYGKGVLSTRNRGGVDSASA